MWQTGTATDYLDLLDKLVKTATGNNVSALTVAAGGTGYTVGDVVTISGGTFTFAATAKVLTAPAGVVATVRIVTGGAYTANPSSPSATTGGTGTGLTLNVTMAATGWTSVLNNAPGERETILRGTGAGSDNIYVGFKTFSLTAQDGFSTAKNWGVVAMTGFSSGLLFHQQAGISPGFDSSGVADTAGGAFVPLKPSDAFNISFWFNINAFRIIMVAKVQNASLTRYVSCYAGFLNRFGTTSEQPYPIYVAGSSARRNTYYLDTEPRITGLTEAIGITGLEGPQFYRTFDSLWMDVKNSVAVDTASPSRAADKKYTVYPCGQTTIAAAVDDTIVADGSGWTWDDVIPPSGIPGTQTFKLQRTPMTGGNLFLLIPATVVSSENASGRNDLEVVGEMDSVFWFDAVGVSAEDTITQGTTIYRCFYNGNRTGEFSFMAITEFQ